MLTPLITGLFALGGVALGVMLEPVKSIFTARARARQERAERCARLVEAATAARSALIRLNTIHRRQTVNGDTVADGELPEAERIYYKARNEVRQTVLLLELSGPEDLAAQAHAVREADRTIGAVRFATETSGATFERYTLPPALRQAADVMEEEIRAFVEVARRHVR